MFPGRGWFTEGFDTPDLRQAEARLDTLACFGKSSLRLIADQRVHHREPAEAAEAAVRRPQLAHPVLATQRRDPGIVDLGAGNVAAGEQRAQCRPMRRRSVKSVKVGDSSQAST